MKHSIASSVLFFIFFTAEALQQSESHDNFNLKMIHLARSVAEMYMSDRRKCIVVISDRGLLGDFDSFEFTTLRVNFDNVDDGCDPQLHRLILNAFYEKCSSYVVQISKPNCFFPAWFLARNGSTYEKHNPRILFLPVLPHAGIYGEEILAMNQTNISADILIAETSTESFQENVIYPLGPVSTDPSQWPVTLYTNNFWLHVGEPGRIGRVHIDAWSWERGFKSNADLYPDKVRDLRGKVLRLAAFPYLPYGNNEPLDGSDARIVIEFCNVFNCTLVDVDDGNLWGQIFPENGTGVVPAELEILAGSEEIHVVSVNNHNSIGEAGMIYMELSDFGVGANYLWLEYWPYLEFSNSYLYGALTIMVPKTKLLGGLLTPFLPFPLSLWAVIVLCVFASAIGLHLFTLATYKFAPHLAENIRKDQKFITLTDSLVRSISMLVMQQPQRLVCNSPVRHLFTALEFVYLVLAAAYAAELYDFLTIPRTTAPINSINDLAKSDLIWMTDHEVWVFGLTHSEDPDLRRAVANFRAHPTPELIKMTEKDVPYGLGIERMAGGHYTEMPYISDKFIEKSRVMRENYYVSPLVVNMQKGSPYANKLNNIISRMVNGGLYYAWEGDCVRKYLNYTKQLTLQWSTRPVQYPPKVITVSAIEGALLLYFIGVSLSVGIFFVELYVKNVKKADERCAKPS